MPENNEQGFDHDFDYREPQLGPERPTEFAFEGIELSSREIEEKLQRASDNVESYRNELLARPIHAVESVSALDAFLTIIPGTNIPKAIVLAGKAESAVIKWKNMKEEAVKQSDTPDFEKLSSRMGNSAKLSSALKDMLASQKEKTSRTNISDPPSTRLSNRQLDSSAKSQRLQSRLARIKLTNRAEERCLVR